MFRATNHSAEPADLWVGAVKQHQESWQNVKYAVELSGTNSSALSSAPAQESLKQENSMWVKEEIYVSEREQIIYEPAIHKPVIILSKEKWQSIQLFLDSNCSGVDFQWCDALFI